MRTCDVIGDDKNDLSIASDKSTFAWRRFPNYYQTRSHLPTVMYRSHLDNAPG